MVRSLQRLVTLPSTLQFVRSVLWRNRLDRQQVHTPCRYRNLPPQFLLSPRNFLTGSVGGVVDCRNSTGQDCICAIHRPASDVHKSIPQNGNCQIMTASVTAKQRRMESPPNAQFHCNECHSTIILKFDDPKLGRDRYCAVSHISCPADNCGCRRPNIPYNFASEARHGNNATPNSLNCASCAFRLPASSPNTARIPSHQTPKSDDGKSRHPAQ